MSIAFNGSSSRIAFPSGFFNYERTQPVSFSAAVYLQAASLPGGFTDWTIFSRMLGSVNFSGHQFAINSPSLNNGRFSVQVISTTSNRISVYTTSNLALSTWYVLTATYSGSSTAAGVKLYINGAIETNVVQFDSLTTSALNAATPMIGSRNAANAWWNGQIQNLGLWDVELTTEECASLGRGFSPPSVRPQSLLAHTPLIRDIIDVRGNALTGTSTSVGANNPRIIW